MNTIQNETLTIPASEWGVDHIDVILEDQRIHRTDDKGLSVYTHSQQGMDM
jgi:hypothetical protein